MLLKNLSQWLSEYGETHQNSLNQWIHKACVPAIVWSIIGVLHLLPPLFYFRYEQHNIPVTWAHILSLFALGFYLSLSIRVAFFMLMFILSIFFSQAILRDMSLDHFGFYVLFFVVAWIGQFVGHKIEGKKPAFFKDVSFLLIGPVWVFRKILEDSDYDKDSYLQN